MAAGLAGLSVAITGSILVDIAHTHAVSTALAGQLMTIGSLAGMLGTLALSPVLDRIDRRASLRLALVLATVGDLYPDHSLGAAATIAGSARGSHVAAEAGVPAA